MKRADGALHGLALKPLSDSAASVLTSADATGADFVSRDMMA
jgi:hypothetical protein